MNSSELKFVMMVLYGAVLLAAWVASFVIYVWKGFLFYKLCGENGIKQKWLAWVPIANDYTMLKLSGISTKFVVLFAIVFACDILANFDSIGDARLFEVFYFVTSLIQSVVAVCSMKKIVEKYQRGRGLLIASIIYFGTVVISVCSLIW